MGTYASAPLVASACDRQASGQVARTNASATHKADDTLSSTAHMSVEARAFQDAMKTVWTSSGRRADRLHRLPYDLWEPALACMFHRHAHIRDACLFALSRRDSAVAIKIGRAHV